MLSWFFATGIHFAVASEPSPPRYDDSVVVRVSVTTVEQAQTVTELARDVWTEHVRSGELDVVLDSTALPALRATGFPYRIVVSDLQRSIDDERGRLLARQAFSVEGGAAPPAFFDEFRDFDEVLQYMSLLAATFPERASSFRLGTSVEGRSIAAVRVTAPGDASERPSILVSACQHAREWISVMVTTCVADALVRGYDDDPEIASLLEQVVVVLVPIVNPDGYVYTWTTDRFWRKNRNGRTGVDLNRNWGVAWGGDGSSSDPMHGNYRGTAPFSEPESAALRDLIVADQRFVSHLDFHAYGQLVLYPWGYGPFVAPADAALSSMAKAIEEALGSVHGVPYTAMQAVEFYPSAGNAPDWTYGSAGLYSFTVELRPANVDGDFTEGFVLPPEQIASTCEESMAAIRELLAWSAMVDPARPGDDGSATSTSGSEGDDGGESSESPTSTATSATDGDTGFASDGSTEASSSGRDEDGDTDAETSTGAGMNARGSCNCAVQSRLPTLGGLLLLFSATRRRTRRGHTAPFAKTRL